MSYEMAYRIGFTPSEGLLDHRPFADTLLTLVARNESGEPPFDVGMTR